MIIAVYNFISSNLIRINTFSDSKLFTGCFQDFYYPPNGLCFDHICGDDPIMDNPEMTGNNIEHYVALFNSTARSFVCLLFVKVATN